MSQQIEDAISLPFGKTHFSLNSSFYKILKGRYNYKIQKEGRGGAESMQGWASRHQGPFITEQLLNRSQMIQVDFKVFKELSQPGSGLCVSEGNENWKVMESDSRQIAGTRSSPSGETGEDRSPPLMFRRGRRRAQLCVWGRGGCREREYERMTVQYEHAHTHAILSAYWDIVCVSDSFGLCLCVYVCVCAHEFAQGWVCVCVREGPAAQDLLSLSSWHFLATDWQIFTN